MGLTSLAEVGRPPTMGYNAEMDKVVKRFSSFRESDEADRQYYQSLTPVQRLDILLELNARYRDLWHDAPQGLERVYRIVQLGEC
jgi:hypothetical protein